MEPLTNQREVTPLLAEGEIRSSVKTARNIRGLEKIKEAIHLHKLPLPKSQEATEIGIHTIKEVTIPIRRKNDAKRIDEETDKRIAQVDEELNEALFHVPLEDQAVMAPHFFQERERKVQAIREEAAKEKGDLSNRSPEFLVTEQPNLEDQKIEKLLEDYKIELTAIEKKESEALQKVENDLASTLKLMSDSSLRMRMEASKERKQKIEKIRQEATDKKNLLLLKATQAFRPYQKDFFLEMLSRYFEREVLEEPKLKGIFSSIINSFQQEKNILEEVLSSNRTSPPDSEEIIRTIKGIEEENQLRLHLLQPAVMASTTLKLKVLTSIETKLTPPFLQKEKPSELKPSELKKATELLEQLDKMHADYFVAEAISTDLAQKVAEKAANQLEKEIEKLIQRVTDIENEEKYLEDNQRSSVEATKIFYQNLTTHLKTVQQAYEQIALDNDIRVKGVVEFKDHVATFRQASMLIRQGSQRAPLNFPKPLSQRPTNTSENEELLRRTSTLTPTADLETTNFTLQRQLSQRQPSIFSRSLTSQQIVSLQNSSSFVSLLKNNSSSSVASSLGILNEDLFENKESIQLLELDFLGKLEEIPSEKDDYFLLGRRGEIELHPPFRTEEKSEKIEGVHLVRLAVFRDRGPEGLAHFDEYFQEKIRLETPLTLGELITFIDNENEINPSAYYLSPARSLEELIVGEPNEKEEAKLIKVNSTSFTFSLTSHIEKRSSDHKETFNAVQEKVKNFFSKLPEPECKKILERFSKEFEETERKKEKSLTVGNLRSFLIKEIERQQLEFTNVDITEVLFEHLSPHMETLYAGLITASGVGAGAMILLDVAKSLLIRLGVFQRLRNMITR